MKKGFFSRLGDVSRIHHRAAFADVEYRINRFFGSYGFLSLVEKRYSCRKFKSQPVSDVKINRMLEAARLAPTASNKQPVHVWAVTSETALERLRAVHPLFGAPMAFMVGCKPDEAWVRSFDGKNGAETDAAIIGTHLMLCAADLDLGCTWIGAFDPVKLAKAFPETAGYEITALFAVGVPASDATPSERHSQRKSMEEFVTEL
ncbi:MAG: nitroreductase family protein [Candidatus Cryptobacteroides sp.]|jgi:nitroreductase